MSELQPQPEMRSRSELRVRGGSSAPGLARHGRLRKASPWGTIAKFVAAALAVILVSGASVGAIAFNSIYSKRTVVALVGETEGPPPQIGAIEGGFNILIVGSDTRGGQYGIGGDVADDSSVLNDVNILLHVSQDQTNAVAISFPRDMVVGIPECPWDDGSGDTKGYSTEPINVALYYGGLPCVVLTVEELTGLPIQFAGMITFDGVVDMSDAIGGVDVCITAPMYDPYTGIDLPTAGTWKLSGFNALAFLRSRHGVGDGSDLTRISSQQVYLSSLVRTLKSQDTLGDVKKLYNLANAAVSSMTLSSSLADVSTMVSIALALKNIPLERVTFVQYPGNTGGDGIYAGKVRPDTATGDEMMALIAADQPFVLAETTDGRGSTIDPNAPVATPDPTAAPVDNSGLPVIEGVKGQTAADYTCSITQVSSGDED
ncbi:MAG TPA: LCP family protein [Rhodoglobus sp.]|jgi:LCP family protein required for cell wall assembly|nr:LCP family protein [Rhodoglobus sp.]HOW00445.1 LCP family protein [Rhodoglobus sp.]HQG70580.1 LCP family protein [Rhodoglobus sp.]HQI65007.1 LCP family protein [Rhodoglobus sp.]